MMVSNTGSVFRLLQWQQRSALIMLGAGAVAAVLHMIPALQWLTLPATPLAVVGGAIGIFVSFRTNSAYDRWWEGRKLWGRLINTSRHWGSQVGAYLHNTKADDQVRPLVMRHVAYVHALRVLLRKQDPWVDAEFLDALSDEDRARIEGRSNLTHALLELQLRDLTILNDAGILVDHRLESMDETLRHLLDIQGGCERIKKTPFPRGYSFIAERLILYFSCLFPFAIVSELGWFTLPMNLLVCMAFLLISEVGRVLEDPFSMFFNGLPLSAISRMIEVNLREVLGEKEGLPPMRKPDHRGILM